jgi:selenocysteine lyase/cysteine desulfurase
MSLESFFKPYRDRIVGIDATMRLADGREAPIVYADWTASGRLYGPLEEFMLREIGPLVANTHTETTYTGVAMTKAYHRAREIIKEGVGAGPLDSLFFSGFGMTAAVNKLQRMLGLRFPEGCDRSCAEGQRPLVLITHMEHHSNQITWEECDVDVLIVPRDESNGLPDLEWQERLLKQNEGKRLLIGAFSACSNVTGLVTPYRRMAALMHRYGGLCFVDFAASAPYVEIDMHPANAEERLDAITFSPHKFLGGPGASGVLVLSNALYKSAVPDHPGGGTVKWTTPFGTHRYVDEIEAREDGGTPGFLQAIRAALAMELKSSMGVERIREREEEIKAIVLEEFRNEPSIMLLEGESMDRLAIFSLYAPGEHHNLIVRLLNDRFGVQTRGGCSCAGTYGHILFDIKKTTSRHITEMIDAGDLSQKPGWVRVSFHPTMTDAEVRYVARSVAEVIRNYREWSSDYVFLKESGEFEPREPGAPAPDLLSRFAPG